MSGTTIILLRLIHILSGVFWVGSVLFVARFLLPTLRAVGPAGGPVMQQLTQVRKLPSFMMVVAILTPGAKWVSSAQRSADPMDRHRLNR